MGDKNDMTRIENISDFLHQDDPQTDHLLNTDGLESDSLEVSDSDSTESFDSDELLGEESNSFEDTDESSFGSLDDEVDDSSAFGDDTESFDSLDDSDLSSSDDGLSDDQFSAGEESGFEGGVGDDSEFTEDSSPVEENSGFEGEVAASSDEDFESWGGDEEAAEASDSSDVEEVAEAPESSDVEVTTELPDIPQPEERSIPAPVATSAPEKLDDIKDFGQSIKVGKREQAGDPPFSVVLKNIKYKEERDAIYSILVEYGLVSKQSEKDIQVGLDNGALLISHISEYLAVFLAHKFRLFDLDIYVGQSEELHPTKIYRDVGGKGLVEKSNVEQNRKESGPIK
jgi:hypothetical protein